MSGPKVVKIVTREEIIAICEGHLAALQAAFERWERVGKRNEIITDDDRALARARIEKMRRLLDADEFEALQKQVPREIAFLQKDIETRIEQAAEKAAAVRMEGVRRAGAARSLIDALEKKGLEVPPSLRRIDKLQPNEVNAAISEGFRALSIQANGELTDRQRELALLLGGGGGASTIDEWLKQSGAVDLADRAMIDLERRFAELASFDPERAEAFRSRLDHVARDHTSRRSVLVDSLAFDIAQARRAAGVEADAIQNLRAIAAQLRLFKSDSASHMSEQVKRVLASSIPPTELEQVTGKAKAVLDELLAEQANLARRRAILEGLGELGYDVSESMQTAWVENGKVVLRSKKSSGYGVEVGGDPAKSVQVRTVAFGGPDSGGNPVADIAAETEFCGDFASLQARLATQGSELSIVKALGIGTTPVKRIPSAGSEVAHSAIDAPAAAAVKRL